MKRSTATCWWCEKPFRYLQFTKPRRYCSYYCEYHRERHLQNERRRAKAAARRLLARGGTLNQ
jgi:hypothetical protein